MKIKLWIKVENDIIIDRHRSNAFQPDMIEVPWNSDVKRGENVNWYNKNWKRIHDKLLIEKGIRIDNRGWYWNKNNYKESFCITFLDIKAPVNFTSIPPIKNEPCVWIDDEWVIDNSEKRINEIVTQLQELDQKYLTTRILAGIALNDEYAIEQFEKHEKLAEPLRAEYQKLVP